MNILKTWFAQMFANYLNLIQFKRRFFRKSCIFAQNRSKLSNQAFAEICFAAILNLQSLLKVFVVTAVLLLSDTFKRRKAPRYKEEHHGKCSSNFCEYIEWQFSIRAFYLYEGVTVLGQKNLILLWFKISSYWWHFKSPGETLHNF